LSLPASGDAALRVGLIGYGYAGSTFHAPLLQSTPGLQLRAVASGQAGTVQAELGAGVEVHDRAEALIARDDLDLVVIATPNASHHPLARAALLAGKAVVVDKPFALDQAQALDLVELAEREQRLLSVFHNRRWDGDFLTAAALLRSGRLGRLVEAEFCFDRYRPLVRPRWREAAALGGGLWLDLGPHLLDQALQLFGAPRSLQADIVCQRDGARADDCFRAVLRYASGLRVGLHASTLCALPGARLTLHGSRGSYRKSGLDRQEDALRSGLRPDPGAPAAWGADPEDGQLALAGSEAEGSPDLPTVQTLPTQAGRYGSYYVGIRDALRGSGPNPVPARQALAVMSLLDLGRRSAEQGRELTCPSDLESLLEP
jgi:predicted dehydrogenase